MDAVGSDDGRGGIHLLQCGVERRHRPVEIHERAAGLGRDGRCAARAFGERIVGPGVVGFVALRRLVVAGGREQDDARAVRAKFHHERAEIFLPSVESLAAIFQRRGIRFTGQVERPADVIHAEHHGRDGAVVRRDIPIIARECAGGGVAGNAAVEGLNVPRWKPREIKQLDVAVIRAAVRDAVTHREPAVALAKRAGHLRHGGLDMRQP